MRARARRCGPEPPAGPPGLLGAGVAGAGRRPGAGGVLGERHLLRPGPLCRPCPGRVGGRGPVVADLAGSLPVGGWFRTLYGYWPAPGDGEGIGPACETCGSTVRRGHTRYGHYVCDVCARQRALDNRRLIVPLVVMVGVAFLANGLSSLVEVMAMRRGQAAGGLLGRTAAAEWERWQTTLGLMGLVGGLGWCWRAAGCSPGSCAAWCWRRSASGPSSPCAPRSAPPSTARRPASHRGEEKRAEDNRREEDRINRIDRI